MSTASAVLAHADGRALGTSTRLVVTDPDRLDRATQALDSCLHDIDAACSRFRSDSELTQVNALAGHETPVSPRLMAALVAAVRGAQLTDGAVDPTVGSAIRAIGYTDDFAATPRDGAPITVTVQAVPGWRCIRLHEASRTVFIPRGVELDLGSTAKAFAADLAAGAAVEAMGGGGALVSLGGDIAMAGVAPPGGWRIQVADDSTADVDPSTETVAVVDGGVATSSITVRRWRRGGVDLHHIVDPATGLPADGPWRTVTAAAASCLDANIAATAAIVRGAGAVTWLTRQGLPARLVDRVGVVVRCAGWPAQSEGLAM